MIFIENYIITLSKKYCQCLYYPEEALRSVE